MTLKALNEYRKRVPSFKIKEISPGVLHLEFLSYKALGLTMLRFQENYESPLFRNKMFSVSEFYDYYTKLNDSFSYHQDWHGFNFPSSVIERFKNRKDLSAGEKKIVSLLKKYKRFYLIGTKKGDILSLNHELAHAKYFLNKEYRLKVKKALSNIDLKPIKDHLRSGYHSAVFTDECHAYIAFEGNFLEECGINFKPYKRLEKKLLRLFWEKST